MKTKFSKNPRGILLLLGVLALVLIGGCLTKLVFFADRPLEVVGEEISDGNSSSDSFRSERKEYETKEPEEEQECEVDPEEELRQAAQKQLEEILNQMTLEEKVGQMFMARFPSYENAAYYAETYFLGGYVLFDSEFAYYSSDEVRNVIDGCQAVSVVPMLMAVDEEGGTVTRVSDYFRESPFLSPRRIYEEGGFDAIEADTKEKCELLLSLHLNMNLAPVADMTGDPEYFMYDRSFGTDTELVMEFVQREVAIMNAYGVGCSLKHFPGYGANLDTHTGMSVDERDIGEFYRKDLRPFEAGIHAGAGTIMVSHNIVTCFDETFPASLSPAVHQAARKLGFDGVLITDDMAMGAIVDYYGAEEAAVQAVLAGNDMLISSNFTVQYDAVLDAVREGVLQEEAIDASVMRILWLKWSMGLI